MRIKTERDTDEIYTSFTDVLTNDEIWFEGGWDASLDCRRTIDTSRWEESLVSALYGICVSEEMDWIIEYCLHRGEYSIYGNNLSGYWICEGVETKRTQAPYEVSRTWGLNLTRN